MDGLVRDLRYGSRMLLKDRRFSITAILTLATCLAVNIAVFTIVNAVLLQPLSLPGGERLVLMANQYPGPNAADNPLTRGIYSHAPDYFDRLRHTTVFESQAMFTTSAITVEMDDRPQRAQAMVATPSLFRLMSVAPFLGRAFDDAEGELGNERRVMLSYETWQRWFNGDPAAIGRDVRVNSRPYRIVGVMPRDFVFINPRSGDRVEVWLPLAFTEAQKTSRHESSAPGSWIHIARLRPDATIEQAREQLRALDAANFANLPEWRSVLTSTGFYSSVERAETFMIREVKPMLYLLWGGGLALLLIGGVNIANIVLARSMTRLKEIATRLSLGAGRARVVRQLVIENIVLALVSGAVGLLAGSWLLDSLTAIGLSRLPRAAEIRLTADVVFWTLAACVTCGAIIGLVPIGLTSMTRLSDVLRSDTRSMTFGPAGRLARYSLIVVQVALAFTLLLGSGLLLATLRQLLEVDPGFSTRGVVSAAMTLPSSTYPDDPAIVRVLTRALDAVRGIPGVVAAAATDSVPLDGSRRSIAVMPDDTPITDPPLFPRLVVVTPGYFDAMRIALVRGRDLEDRDREGTTRVAVVDERLARRFWPDRDPIGQTFYMPFDPSEAEQRTNPNHRLTVVGVVRDVRQMDVAGQP